MKSNINPKLIGGLLAALFLICAPSLASGQGDSLGSLTASGKVKVETSGTGETIGHVADLKIQNLTDQPMTISIAPMILESSSGKNQHYACPKGQTVVLAPNQTKTVPMNGVCLNRDKPPVGKGVGGDLVMNEANPAAPQNPNSHLPATDANKLLQICTAKYEAAEKLQKEGALKNLPYRDAQKQKDIVVQWSTWTDPVISQMTGSPPATKGDLEEVVNKQAKKQGPMTAAKKKKLEEGIDAIFAAVELTTAKAKDLEKPEKETLSVAGTTVAETPSGGQPVSAPAGTPGETVAGTPTATPQGPGTTTTQPTPTPSPTPTPIPIGDTNAHQEYVDGLDKKGGKEDLIAVEEHVRPQTEWTRGYVNTSQECWTDFHVCITNNKDKGPEGTFNFDSVWAGFRDATITVGGKERNMKFEKNTQGYQKCAYIILGEKDCVKPGQSVTFNCIVGCYSANGTGCRYHLEVRASTDGK